MVPSVALLATLLTATAPASGDVHGFLTGNLRVAVSYYDSVYVRNASQFRLDDAEPLHAGVALRACFSPRVGSFAHSTTLIRLASMRSSSRRRP